MKCKFLFTQVLGYPSKRVGLFIKQSVIFRSDSNGEDLEGYAGAGLYDRYEPNLTPFHMIQTVVINCIGFSGYLISASYVEGFFHMQCAHGCGGGKSCRLFDRQAASG